MNKNFKYGLIAGGVISVAGIVISVIVKNHKKKKFEKDINQAIKMPNNSPEIKGQIDISEVLKAETSIEDSSVRDISFIKTQIKPEITEYYDRVSKYSDISKKEEEEDEDKEEIEEEHVYLDDDQEEPYILPYPEEFGTKEGYNCITLKLFSDLILTDYNNIPIEDVKHTVGYGFEDKFGSIYADPGFDDIIYIRNDRLKTDYEIALVEEEYQELAFQNPTLYDDAVPIDILEAQDDE